MSRGPAAGRTQVQQQPPIASHTGLAMVVVMTGVSSLPSTRRSSSSRSPRSNAGCTWPFSSVIWIVIGYLLVITLLATQVGRLGDMFGRVRMYEMGFLVFILGSLACALAWNESAIIGFRILQGIGGAFVTANSGAVIADLYPPQRRGRAYGYNAVGWSLGAVLGVVVGGLIVTYVSWRWIFWINVPIGAAALVLATRVLHERSERARRHFDFLGMITLGLGLFGVLWAMTTLTTASFDASAAGCLIGGAVLIAVFVLVELRQDEPMLHLSLFKVPTLAPSLLRGLVPRSCQLRGALPGDHVPARPPRAFRRFTLRYCSFPAMSSDRASAPSPGAWQTGSGPCSRLRSGSASRSLPCSSMRNFRSGAGFGWSCWRAS